MSDWLEVRFLLGLPVRQDTARGFTLVWWDVFAHYRVISALTPKTVSP